MSELKLITVQMIPHADQRYASVGDYQETPNGRQIAFSISAQADWRHEMLIAVHEIIEKALCKHRGIPDAAIDAFDLAYETARPADSVEEPGDDPAAPYFREHQFATLIESELAQELDVDWDEYERVLEGGL